MRVYGFQEIERQCIHYFSTWPKKNPKIHVKITMHDLQSKPTKKPMLWTCLRKQTIGKEVVEHTHTHTYIHTYIQMSLEHMHTNTHTQLLLQSTFIASISIIMVSSHVLDMASSIVPYK